MTNSPLQTNFLNRHKRGIIVFALCVLISTLVAIAGTDVYQVPQIPQQTTQRPSVQSSDGKIKISSQLSQAKLVQGSGEELILEVSIETPPGEKVQQTRTPVDMVVILDRSSSMNSDQKFNLAKKAIQSLMKRLNSDDRISLITFSHDGTVQLPLSYVNQECQNKMSSVLASLQPGGSTNMGKGLQLANQQLANPLKGHRSRVILLSDGQANSGIHDPAGLQNLVKDLTRNDVVVSTIGMGLGFNENVMSSLADHGMGSFNYLEHLAGLDGLFESDLNDARQQYTNFCELNFNLPKGINIVDAGGYPINRKAETGNISIPLGQLLYGRTKNLMVAFQVPTNNVGDIELGRFEVNYKSPEGQLQSLEANRRLAVQVVEPERRQEAIATINQDVYKRNWFDNSLGRLKKSISQSLKDGDRHSADQQIATYEKEVKELEEQTGIQIINEQWDNEVQVLKEDVNDSFRGNAHEQKVKQNRYAKKNLSASRESQRK